METIGQLKFEFSLEEVNIILRGLQELPFKLSSELIVKIKTEGDKQFEANKKDTKK